VVSTHEKETWYLDPTSPPENRNSRGGAEVRLEMEQPFLQEFVFLRASAPPREELL